MPTKDSVKALKELETILNDPTVPFHPEKVWELLAEISVGEGAAAGTPVPLPDGTFHRH
jgi:hypothetical protein